MSYKKKPVAAIILAAGKGTRLKSTSVNKVVLPFHGKPIIEYAVDVMEAVADPVVVVVGAFAGSVKDALKNHPNVVYAHQEEQRGTGDAARVGYLAINSYSPSLVLVGYGDHMMFYQKETVQKLLKEHDEHTTATSLITVTYNNPDELAWGRIVRDADGAITGIVEQKDTTEEERKINELNVGFYLFDAGFLRANLQNIEQSPVTGEYYLTELVKLAIEQGREVKGLKVPFEEVGIGINRAEELEASQKLYKK